MAKDYDYRIVDNRAVGAKLPMSVALSIPVEEHLMKENIDFEAVYLNVRTLFRAFHGSYKKEQRPGKADLIMGFIEELISTKALLQQLGYTVVVYHPKYPAPKTYFKHANPKVDSSPVERVYASVEDDALVIANKEGQIDLTCNYRIPGVPKRTAIITNYPIDLLSAPNFGELVLLETNSGKLKTRREWHTKLGVNEKHSKRIPFNLMTLQLFGDKAKLFMSVKELKLKKAVLELAQEKRWTSLTTRSKVMVDIKALEKDMQDRLNSMLQTKYP